MEFDGNGFVTMQVKRKGKRIAEDCDVFVYGTMN